MILFMQCVFVGVGAADIRVLQTDVSGMAGVCGWNLCFAYR